MIDKYKSIMRAAGELRDDIVGGRPPAMQVGSTFKHGKPCCLGGWILTKAGYVPAPDETSNGAKVALTDFLGEKPPMWLNNEWYSIEEANDDLDIRKERKGAYLCMTLQGLMKAIVAEYPELKPR